MTVVRRRPDHAEELLRRQKQQLLDDIDSQIGQARLAGRTISEGQDVVYALKEAEARELLAKPRSAVTEKAFPMLSAEAGATGRLALELATDIVAAADLERTRLAMLEGLRMSFKARVKAASSNLEADTAATEFAAEVMRREIPVASALATRAAQQQEKI